LEDDDITLCGRDLKNNKFYEEISLDDDLEEDHFYSMVLHEDGEHAIVW
jgi:hypothetical protein